MKNYRRIFVVIFILFTSIIYSQNNRRYEREKSERESMYRLLNLIEKERLTEQRSQKKVLDVYYNTKDFVRERSHLLTKDEIKGINRLQDLLWGEVKSTIKAYGGYTNFLRERLVVLFAYNDVIKKHLYLLIDSDDELSYANALHDFYTQIKI